MASAPETRETTSLTFDPQGPDSTLPETFTLVCWHQPQRRRKRAGGSLWVNDGPARRRVLEAGISRRKLEAILADGIAALAFDGKDG